VLPTELSQQTLFFLRFMGLGAMLGLIYDLLRAIRTYFRLKRWGTGLLDILFCMIGLLAFLLLMLQGTDGRLRFYLPLGMVIGFFFYRKAASRWILRLLLWLLRLGGHIADELWAFLLWIFSFPRGN